MLLLLRIALIPVVVTSQAFRAYAELMHGAAQPLVILAMVIGLIVFLHSQRQSLQAQV